MQSSANSNLATENSVLPSPIDEKGGRGWFTFTVFLLFGLFAFQLWFHATRTSATIDESPHIFAGYRYWQCGDFGVNVEHPPLLKLIAAGPLIFKDLIQPSWDCGTKITSTDESYVAGNLFISKNNPDNIVVPARLSAALISLFLAMMVLLAAREMFGRFESVIALSLLVFEPNIIAHGSLVTTDMAIAATMFAAVYAFYRYRKDPTWIRFLVVGLATGATLASKHSGILILPIMTLLFISDFFLARKTEIEGNVSRRFLRRVADFAGIVFIGFAVLWAFYGFRYDALPNDSQPPALVASIFENAPPEIINSPVVKTMREVTRIFPESYAAGLFHVLRSGNDRPMFLFGDIYPTARWFYFPAAFSIKTSVALLVLLALGLLTIGLYRTRRREMLFLLLPAFLFFGVSLTSGLNIG
ncbi:MAG: glycosyltransferase family 39 protein, partial [bacterium]|nr:glycosyltransferase family 39 protein [bacterium]